jgi:hypothetical protein
MAQTTVKPTIIIFFLLQIILYVALARTVRPNETDFPAFYSAARIWSVGHRPYDLEEQCQVQLPIRGVPCLPFAHPPVLLPLISLVSNNNFDSSYYRWTILMLIAASICILPAHRISGEWKNSIQSLLFFPLIIAIALGQDTPFILLAVLSWACLLIRKKDFLSGLVLSVTVLKPQIAILLAVPLLFSRPRAFAGFSVGAILLTIYSLILIGPQGFRDLFGIVNVMSQGTGFGINSKAMINATALLVRAGQSAKWSWAIFALGVVIISLIWKKLGTSLNELVMGITVALFCAPHLHLHDLSLLTLSLVNAQPLITISCSLFLLIAYFLGWQQWAGYAFIAAACISYAMRRQRKYEFEND